MTPPPDRLVAALGNTYRLERELGQGGMATVYLAQDLKHDRKVAIKVLKPELAAVLGAERFVVEIKTTASLQHPHILPLFDSGAADGFLYDVMPYIEGETLRSRLDRETQLGVADAVRIAASVADALDYAHRHGVIHRDIKPENILLHDGRPMVADFGIALAVSAAAGGRMTETGLSLGTPHYMSPEQATAEKEISARADVYSLGSVLFEMLTGQPPHLGGSAQQIIMKIITEPAQAVTALRKSVPAHVAAAVATALEKLPADRFESARAFAEALANPAFTVAGGGATAIAAGSGRGVSRSVFGVTAALAGIALVAAIIGWLRPAPVQPVSRFAIAFPDSQGVVATQTNRIAITPDGRTIVYVAGSNSQARLMVRRLDQLRATPLAGTEGAINPAISPDGDRVAFVSGVPRAIRIVPLAGGPATVVTDTLVDTGGLTWADDGYLYYDGHLPGDGIARVKVTGGQPEPATMPDTAAGESWHVSPVALPNGRGVLVAIAHQRGVGAFAVGVVGPKGGKAKVLVAGVRAAYAAGHLLYVTGDGLLMAAPFDQDRLEITGPAVAVAEGLAVRGLGRVDFDLSRNGSLIYLTGVAAIANRELVWVDRTGGATPVDPGWTAPIMGRPALSRDGRSALLTVATRGGLPQLMLKQLDRGPASKIGGGVAASWLPGGREFIATGQRGFLRGPVDGSVAPRETVSIGPLGAPEVSPDGKWIVANYASDLYLLPADGSAPPRPLVVNAGNKFRSAISPDGRWVAYSSDESGRFEIYVRPFPEAQASKHQVSVAGGMAPRWAASGRELFLVDEKGDLNAVPVTLGATFTAGPPVRLFAAEAYGVPTPSLYDVAADGKRFLMSRPVGASAQPDQVVLVENFFTVLKAGPAK